MRITEVSFKPNTRKLEMTLDTRENMKLLRSIMLQVMAAKDLRSVIYIGSDETSHFFRPRKNGELAYSVQA